MPNLLASRDRLNAPAKIAFAFLWLFVLSFPAEKAIHIDGFGTVSRLLGVVALGAGALAVLITGRVRMPIAAHGFLAVFVLWSALTLRWSIDPDSTFIKATTYLQLLGMLWLIWEFCPTQLRIHRLMQAYVLGTVFSATDTVVRFLSAHQTYYNRYAVEGFDPNDLALTLSLSIPLSYYLSLQNNGRRAWIYWLQIGLVMGAILLSASRTGFLASCAAASIVPLTFASLRPKQRMFLIVAFVAALAAGVAMVPETSWKRLATIGTEVSAGTLNNREVIWKAGLEAFRRHPIAGVGAGAYPRSVEPLFGWPSGWLIVAHNTFLSVLVETGLAGATLFALFLLMLLAAICRLKGNDRVVWFIMLTVWFIGVNTLSWETQKPTWLLFALALAHAYMLKTSGARRPKLQPAPLERARREYQVVLP